MDLVGWGGFTGKTMGKEADVLLPKIKGQDSSAIYSLSTKYYANN